MALFATTLAAAYELQNPVQAWRVGWIFCAGSAMDDVSNLKKVVVPDRFRSRALSCVEVKSEFTFDEDNASPFSNSIA